MSTSMNKVAVIALTAVLLSACHTVRPLLINGQANFSNGRPITDTNVVITELHGHLFRMPEITSRTKVKTNNKGRFLVTIKYKGGPVTVHLSVNLCKRGNAYVEYSPDDLKGLTTITPTLVAKPTGLDTQECKNK